ncbi:hypothetical protein FA95DRAFT_1593112 [Auriscalpium vulgare]|uniref:Uncharacterized protein n=1 Tax=Auriscalpium vulgare TaxID=40419 RepID=A0ACB8S5P5_9AGAM|nr:hypothetical protein FA95DRAFT_1593112 [Auriscalpium vulgare]
MSTDPVRSYVDCGVQTGSPPPSSPPLQSARAITPPFSDEFSNLADNSQVSPISATSTQVSSAYNQSLVLHSPPLFVVANARYLKPPRLPRQKPSQFHGDAGRLFSLPETTPLRSTKAELNITQRVVSMPEGRILDYSLSSDSLNASLNSAGSMQSDNDTDSVLIIENNGELSEAFLRNESSEEFYPPAGSEIDAQHDEGWISWAKSPPRPIPALHGPLSLPYARCPSGAEGTIIEERDHLPRMIWGLDAEDQTSILSQSDPHLAPGPGNAPLTPLSVRHGSPARKRYVSDVRGPPRTSHHAAILPRSPDDARPRDQERTLQPKPGSYTHGSGNHYHEEVRHNAIDLDLLRASGLPTTHRGPGYVSEEDLAHALKDVLQLRDINISNDFSTVNVQPLDYFPSSFGYDGQHPVHGSRPMQDSGRPTMKVSSRPALGSALPQIVIEPRSPEKFRARPQRPTAMEIAQHYHQQQRQLHRAGNVLPTPPSSSSPLWSSEFSPYQDSVPSPGAVYKPQYSAPAHDYDRNASDGASQLRRLVHKRMPDMYSHYDVAPSLAPAAHISSSRPQQHSDLSSDAVSAQALMDYLARRDLHQFHEDLSSSSAPRPSQNAGLPDMQSYQNIRHYNPTLGRIPPSPTSPEVHQQRGHTHDRQPRSIPLARLIQRRLSAVPEEDTSSTVRGPSPSPPPSKQPRAYGAAQQPHEIYGTPSQYLHNKLATQSRMHEPVLPERTYHAPHDASQVKVRLPMSPIMNRGNGGGGRAVRGGYQKDGRERTEGGMERDDGSAPGGGDGMARRKSRGRPRKVFAGAAN